MEPRADRILRVIRAVAYALMLVAAVTLPAQIDLLSGLISEHIWAVMTAQMGIGAALCLYGQIRRRWTGEFIGLPLLVASFAGFGILQAGVSGWVLAVIPSTALLWAFALGLTARWREVCRYYRAAREAKP